MELGRSYVEVKSRSGIPATLDRDPWGLPYKRVTARLRRSKPNVNFGREQAVSIIANLLSLEDTGVSDEEEIEDNSGGTPGAGDTVHMDDLREATGRLDVNKAVDIDGIPGSIIKLIFRYRAQVCLTQIVL